MSESTVNEVEVAASVKDASPQKSVSEVANGKNSVNGTNAEPVKPEKMESPSKSIASGNETIATAMHHLAAGKRNLLVNDLNAAVTSLAEACEMLAEHYGETSKECGEAYFLYGKALLELARMEAGVIDNVDGEDSEDQNSTEEEDGDGEVEGENEDEAEAEPEQEDDKEEEEPRAREDAESIGSNEAGPSSSKDTKDASAVDAEEEEDPSNLQLSWEMLELAKNIFSKQIESLGTDDTELRKNLESKLSETYQLLGEVSIENEDYAQAVDDLTTCLKQRQKHLPEDSRAIAETHYQLGVALGFNTQFDYAVNALNDAIGVLQKRIDNLKEEKESKDPVKAKDAFYTREREIAEIEAIIPEIREKIADTNDMKAETIKKLGDKRMFEEGFRPEATSEVAPAPQSGDNSKATASIDHLVKKRKKDDSSAEVSDAKKPHVESTSHANGN